jgi:hypothetical protein
MKLIEITFTYDEGWQKECKKNGVMKISRSAINVDEIVSISVWHGELLHEGRVGTKIKTINGSSHVDDRRYDEFIDILQRHFKIFKY